MVTLGTGVGGGIIIGGKMISGFHGAGGEIGHIKMRDDETDTCGCGKKGCLVTVCVCHRNRPHGKTETGSGRQRDGIEKPG